MKLPKIPDLRIEIQHVLATHRRKNRPISYERARQIAHVLLGRCMVCREPLFTKNYCERHTLHVRDRERARKGCKPWQEGKPGRPPKGATK